MFVSDFLVDSPKGCRRVVIGRRWFQVRDCLLQPEAEQN